MVDLSSELSCFDQVILQLIQVTWILSYPALLNRKKKRFLLYVAASLLTLLRSLLRIHQQRLVDLIFRISFGILQVFLAN